GSLSREEREEAEKLLKEGRLSCVVATSSLELGIDVGSVDSVVQVSSPRQVLKLVQRIGRARHGPGMRAVGYVVCDDNLNDIVESAVIIRRALSADFEKARPHDKPYDVLIHTLVGMGLEGGYTVDRALEVLSRSYSFSTLSRDELSEVASKAVELGYVKIRSDGTIEATKKGRLFYMTTTTIVDSPSYEVVDSLTRKTVGNLDEKFVVDLSEGSSIVLGGKLWRVIGADLLRNKIYVEEVPEGVAQIPLWVGEVIPVEYKVAREVCGALNDTALKRRLPPRYSQYVNDVAGEYVVKVLEKHVSRGYKIPSDRRVVVEHVVGRVPLLVIHSCLGTRGNRGIAYLVLHSIESNFAVQPAYKVDPYRVIIALPSDLPPQTVVGLVLKALRADISSRTVVEGMKTSALFDILLLNVARRLRIIPERADPREIKAILVGLRRDSVVAAEAIKEGLTKYVDLDVVAKLVEGIRSGRVRVEISVLPEPSPLAMEGLKDIMVYDRVRYSSIPAGTIAKIVEKRILESVVLLVCLHCGNSWESAVRDLGSRVNCGRCGYGLVGVVKSVSGSEVDDVVRVVRRAIKLKKDYKYKLSKEEVEVFEKLMDTAVLVLEYGRKAVEALVAHGVGPKTAKEALQYDGEKFYLKLYELEKRYMRTRQFWD
ncbi:MAG: helicase-related protein, partial [Sulfolobales archaeon]|nr:helicase-related protein [Sulfolobales archaeon]